MTLEITSISVVEGKGKEEGNIFVIENDKYKTPIIGFKNDYESLGWKCAGYITLTEPIIYESILSEAERNLSIKNKLIDAGIISETYESSNSSSANSIVCE